MVINFLSRALALEKSDSEFEWMLLKSELSQSNCCSSVRYRTIVHIPSELIKRKLFVAPQLKNIFTVAGFKNSRIQKPLAWILTNSKPILLKLLKCVNRIFSKNSNYLLELFADQIFRWNIWVLHWFHEKLCIFFFAYLIEKLSQPFYFT